ncbi:MAG: hypothetical protein PSN37_03275 [Alphaproteobacteria bacterium]|nr:hypothetical protein [Alphaproteobacteria bacterium]
MAGVGVPLANAYVDIAFCDERFAARGQDSDVLPGLQWVGETRQKEAAIVRATGYIDAVFGNISIDLQTPLNGCCRSGSF